MDWLYAILYYNNNEITIQFKLILSVFKKVFAFQLTMLSPSINILVAFTLLEAKIVTKTKS
jgi:hypothetical protein